MYGHPALVQEHAGALAPAYFFSVTVTEFMRMVRACRIRAFLGAEVADRANLDPVALTSGPFRDAKRRGVFQVAVSSTTATNSTRVEKRA